MKILITTKHLIYCAILSVIIIIAGVVLGFKVFPSIVSEKVWESSVLKENTRQYKFFKKIPFPFQIKINFFDVQNPDEILQGAKPIFKEVGPYVYQLLRWKDGITWDADEISYYDWMKFEFDSKASGKLSDEDLVTILNSPFNALLLAVEELSPSALETVNEVLPDIFGKHNSLFSKAKVKDWLFQGIMLCENGGGEEFSAKMLCDQFKAKTKVAKGMSLVGNAISYSYLNFKNNTHLGRLTIKSGQETREDVSTLIKYENLSEVSTWRKEPEKCNKIRSTTTFRPFLSQDMEFESFSEDICRTMPMVFEKHEIIKGINGLKFVIANNTLDSADKNSENYCYCINRSRTMDGQYGCLKDGLLDLTNCVGAPVLLSFPHLLYGDKSYAHSIIGLNADAKKHETFVVLEPISGTPLQVAKRVQFNMFIRAIEDITSIENVTNALVPIFWIEESFTINDTFANMIKKELINTLKILEIIKWALIGLGVTFIIIPTILLIYKN